MKNIKIAKVLKPQGVKGELKIELFIKDEGYYKDIKSVNIDNKSYNVKALHIRQGYGYITLDGVVDRNAAESFRDKVLNISDDAAPTLNIDEYYIEDMIGLNVVDETGKQLGKVTDIEQYGSADVYSVVGRAGVFSFPFIKKLIISVDLETKTMLLDSKVLDEVRVWR